MCLLDTASVRRKGLAHVGDVDVIVGAIRLPDVVFLSQLSRRRMRQVVVQKFNGLAFKEGLDGTGRMGGERR